jgi:hypothetical protein
MSLSIGVSFGKSKPNFQCHEKIQIMSCFGAAIGNIKHK